MNRLHLLIIVFIIGQSSALKRAVLEHDIAEVTEEEMVQMSRNGQNAPSWLSGRFFRQHCGSMGDNITANAPFVINHFFDCISAVSMFNLDGGRVSYSNQYYKTAQYDYWKDVTKFRISRNGVFFPTFGATINPPALDDFNKWVSRKGENFNEKLSSINPNVNFWNVGGNILALAESDLMFQIDPETLASMGLFSWSRVNNANIPNNMQIINHPAHEAVDPKTNETFITQVAFAPLEKPDLYKFYHVMARYSADKSGGRKETFFAREFSLVDVSDESGNCDGPSHYKDESKIPGYMHFSTVTDNYFLIHVNSFGIDPCRLFGKLSKDQDKNETVRPILDSYVYLSSRPVQFVAIHRSGVESVVSISSTSAGFLVHQANAYEQDRKIILEATETESDDIYKRNAMLSSLLANQRWRSAVVRFTLDLDAQTASKVTLLQKPNEFPQINPNYLMKPSRYIYGVLYPTQDDMSCIYKLDTHAATGLVRSSLYEGTYPFEPIFVPDPTGTHEDSGVLLTSGPVLKRNGQLRAFLAILHAGDLSLQSYYETKYSPWSIGLHNRFYHSEQLKFFTESSAANFALFSSRLFYKYCVIAAILLLASRTHH